MKFLKTKDIPLSIYGYSLKKSQYYFNKEVQILFVVKGRVSITVNNETYHLSEKSIFLINNNGLYFIESLEENIIVILACDNKYFNNYYENFSALNFNLKFLKEENLKTEEVNNFWNMLFNIIEALVRNKKDSIIRIKKTALELALLLVNKYADKNNLNIQSLNSEDERIERVIKFINHNYKERLTLSDIAEYVHLNPQYLSRYFSKFMGVTLNEFIYDVRLKESLKDLENEENKITYVALENGFPNIKSYFKIFKEKYNTTPSLYRKKIKENSMLLNINDESRLKDEEILNLIRDYCTDKKNLNKLLETSEEYIINCDSASEPLNRSWNKIISFGRAAEGLRAEWRNQLRDIQKEIPFEYIRFHGIFCDEMMVYSEDSNGHIELNFRYIDELIDFFMEVKIKPFIELSYIPEKLASEKRYMFNWKANISYPKDLKKWRFLVREFIEHIIDRYGIEEVSSWYFEIWDSFTIDNKVHESNMTFFKQTYFEIKGVSPYLKVGGINDNVENLINTNILKTYNDFCNEEDIELDFISLKAYSIKPQENTDLTDLLKKFSLDNEGKLIFQNAINHCVYADENYITNNIMELSNLLEEYPRLKKEVFITEWNTSPDPRDLIHDTCFKGAFIVKNILKNFNKVQGMGYWTFTDIFEEVKTSHDIFHGGLGFITSNGLKKPIYNSYKLLNKLGDVIIEKGKDFLITKNTKGHIQILIHNYCHFENENARCGEKGITNLDRYKCFRESIKNINFTLKGVKGDIVKKVYKINKEEGSVYDQWLKIGGQKNLNSEELEYLKHKSIFGYRVEEVFFENDFKIRENMEPHEVMLIQIEVK